MEGQFNINSVNATHNFHVPPYPLSFMKLVASVLDQK